MEGEDSDEERKRSKKERTQDVSELIKKNASYKGFSSWANCYFRWGFGSALTGSLTLADVLNHFLNHVQAKKNGEYSRMIFARADVVAPTS